MSIRLPTVATMGGVEPTALILLTLLLGVCTGAGFMLAVMKLRQSGQNQRDKVRPKVPQAAEQILGQLPEAAIILDSALQVVFANRAATDSGSVLNQELVEDPAFLRNMRMVMETGAPYLQLPPERQSQDTTRIRAFRLKKRFVTVLVDDVGEAQRVEAMRRDLIANASHEFKTPIAAICLLSEAISEAADDTETVREFATSLNQEAKRLSELSRDIIHLSEAQSELLSSHREPVDVCELVRAQVEVHSSFASARQVELVVTKPRGDKPALTLGRASSLAIAIGNVLSNAIKHSPEGGKVGIGMAFTDAGFEVAITDQGPGIPPETQERVFERFYRADAGRARSEGGTGLGLSIARNTLRSHGGDVYLWSQVGLGSTFTLFFPLHESLKVKTRKERSA